MNTRLIKKQLGSILYNNLLVPRTTEISKVAVANPSNRSKYGLINTDKNNDYFVKYNIDFNGHKHGYIFRASHCMYYQSDSKPNSNTPHKKGDIRMKHISNLKEFNIWYEDLNTHDNKIVASLRQFSDSLRQRLSRRVDASQPNNDDQSSDDNVNQNNNNDDNSNPFKNGDNNN